MDIAVNCFKLTGKFPKEEKFGLSIQITRAGVSILLREAVAAVKKSMLIY